MQNNNKDTLYEEFYAALLPFFFSVQETMDVQVNVCGLWREMKAESREPDKQTEA